MRNYYYEVGYRLNNEQRKLLQDNGFYVYATRSWDNGCGSTLEHRVLVNHETDVICNFKALENGEMANDYYEHMQKFNAKYNECFLGKLKEII